MVDPLINQRKNAIHHPPENRDHRNLMIDVVWSLSSPLPHLDFAWLANGKTDTNTFLSNWQKIKVLPSKIILGYPNNAYNNGHELEVDQSQIPKSRHVKHDMGYRHPTTIGLTWSNFSLLANIYIYIYTRPGKQTVCELEIGDL